MSTQRLRDHLKAAFTAGHHYLTTLPAWNNVTDPPDRILLPVALEKLHTTLKMDPELVWT